MKHSLKGWGLRGLVALAGILLVVLVACNPVILSEYVEYNDGRLKLPALVPGDVLEQPLTIDHETDQLSVRADGVREAKQLTLTMELLKNGEPVAAKEFPLAKVKAKGRLILDMPQVQAPGEYVLRIAATGEGQVKLGGDGAIPAQLNGTAIPAQNGDEEQATGCYVRMTSLSRQYSVPALFSGALLVLLACVPAGGKEARRHD